MIYLSLIGVVGFFVFMACFMVYAFGILLGGDFFWKDLWWEMKVQYRMKRLKDAYVHYWNFAGAQSCGERLLLEMSATARDMRRKMEEEYRKLAALDPRCPKMEYLVTHGTDR